MAIKKAVTLNVKNVNVLNSLGIVKYTLFEGDWVIGEDKDPRIYFDTIYRKSGQVLMLGGTYNAKYHDDTRWYMTLSDPTPVPPEPEPTIVKVHQIDVFNDGSIFVDGIRFP